MATTKKKSPKAGMTVAAYCSKLPLLQRGVAEALRKLVAKEAPEATASVKWSQPVFEQGGPLAYLRPAGAHVTFGFWRGAELADPEGLLEGSGERMRHVKLASVADVKAREAQLAAFIRQAVALNQAKGDPTRRG